VEQTRRSVQTHNPYLWWVLWLAHLW